MEARLRKDGDINIIHIFGHLSYEEVDRFNAVCAQLLDEKVVFNFDGLSFVGSQLSRRARYCLFTSRELTARSSPDRTSQSSTRKVRSCNCTCHGSRSRRDIGCLPRQLRSHPLR